MELLRGATKRPFIHLNATVPKYANQFQFQNYRNAITITTTQLNMCFAKYPSYENCIKLGITFILYPGVLQTIKFICCYIPEYIY